MAISKSDHHIQNTQGPPDLLYLYGVLPAHQALGTKKITIAIRPCTPLAAISNAIIWVVHGLNNRDRLNGARMTNNEDRVISIAHVTLDTESCHDVGT